MLKAIFKIFQKQGNNIIQKIKFKSKRVFFNITQVMNKIDQKKKENNKKT